MLDKKAETRSSFSRCSLFLNMAFILFFVVYFTAENDVFFSNDTGILGKRNPECSYQESKIRPSNY